MHTTRAHCTLFLALHPALALAMGLALHLASAPVHAHIVTENAAVLSPQTPQFHEAFSFTHAVLGGESSWTQQLIFSTDRSNEFQFFVPWIDRDIDRPRGGGAVELDLAYWYRISLARFGDLDQTTEVRGVLELLSRYRWPSELHGPDADGDGGIVWLAPGLQVFPLDWHLFGGSVLFPLAQSIDDAFQERRFGAVLGPKPLF